MVRSALVHRIQRSAGVEQGGEAQEVAEPQSTAENFQDERSQGGHRDGEAGGHLQAAGSPDTKTDGPDMWSVWFGRYLRSHGSQGSILVLLITSPFFPLEWTSLKLSPRLSCGDMWSTRS